jgi:Arc/MetJ-type ribon-helix-helix transcriptional regulator
MNTNLQITLEIKQKIETILEAGGYETETEVIDDALNLLQKRNQLRMAIQDGLKQLDGGEFFEEDQIFNDLEEKAAKLVQAGSE